MIYTSNSYILLIFKRCTLRGTCTLQKRLSKLLTYVFKWLPIQGIYCVQTGSRSNYDGKFKLVGCNKFTLFPILGVERSFPWLQLGKVSVILGKERILSFPRKGVVCNWERIQSFGKASKGERKGKDSYPPLLTSHKDCFFRHDRY